MTELENNIGLNKLASNKRKIGFLPIVLFAISLFILVTRYVARSYTTYLSNSLLFAFVFIGPLIISSIISLFYYFFKKKELSYLRIFFITMLIVSVVTSSIPTPKLYKTVYINDLNIQLQVPINWEPKSTSVAKYAYVNKSFSASISILKVGNKNDYNYKGLEEVYKNSIKTQKNLNGFYQFSEPKNIKIGDYPAIENESYFTRDGSDVVFIYTYIETTDECFGLCLTTYKSEYEKNKGMLLNIRDSFKIYKNQTQ